MTLSPSAGIYEFGYCRLTQMNRRTKIRTKIYCECQLHKRNNRQNTKQYVNPKEQKEKQNSVYIYYYNLFLTPALQWTRVLLLAALLCRSSSVHRITAIQKISHESCLILPVQMSSLARSIFAKSRLCSQHTFPSQISSEVHGCPKQTISEHSWHTLSHSTKKTKSKIFTVI